MTVSLEQGRVERPAPRYRQGWSAGCGGFFFVLIVGGILSLFSADVGLGLSLRIPFTSSNITAAGAIGDKAMTVSALPDYTRNRVGGNQNFISGSQTLTIGPAEGVGIVVIGKQAGAPGADLHLALATTKKEA